MNKKESQATLFALQKNIFANLIGVEFSTSDVRGKIDISTTVALSFINDSNCVQPVQDGSKYNLKWNRTDDPNGPACPDCPLNDINLIKRGGRHCPTLFPDGIMGTPNGLLTGRNMDLLNLFLDGVTDLNEIAARLNVSEKTARNLISQLFDHIQENTGLRPLNKIDALTTAIKRKWINIK